ncbi:MAG TPA: glycosyltransferase family 2 protein, partial [Anaerolineae bacterium]|nr:glycosyltransferase family 2 protein [Anaerolineae bacterium]
YRSNVLDSINFRANSDKFIFDQEIVAQIVECGYRIAEIPVPVRYFAEASSASFFDSTLYGLSIVWLLIRYALHRIGIRKSQQFTCLGQRYQKV